MIKIINREVTSVSNAPSSVNSSCPVEEMYINRYLNLFLLLQKSN